MWKSKFYGAFVLHHRVVLHAIDATPSRWRGDAGSSPIDQISTQVPFILVGTKLDLRNDPETVARLQQKRRMPVNSEDGMQLARELGAYKYIECSALTQQGLKGVFDDSIRCVLDAMKKPKKKKKKCVVA